VAFLDALSALTPEDVASAAAEYLVPERRFVVTLAPAAEGEEPLERPTCADFEAEQRPGESP
jgi:predicted Zn-dependent peptidase